MGGRPKRASKLSIISVVMGGIGAPTLGCAAGGKPGTSSCDADGVGAVLAGAAMGGDGCGSAGGRFRRHPPHSKVRQLAKTSARKNQVCFIRQGIQVAQSGALAATKAVVCQVANEVSHLLIT